MSTDPIAMIKDQKPTRSTRLAWNTASNTPWRSALGLMVLLLSVNNTFATDIKKGSILAGKNIYMHGKLSSGEDVIATTIGDVQLTGDQAACVNCHRHSGLGSVEGTTVAPAITGEILFSEQKIKAHRYQPLTNQTPYALDRPAYTENSLKNTLISGVDINGNPLDILMPRYTFSENDYKYLHAYLNSLSINDAGVTDTILHIATIIDERVSTGKINTMLSTLERYISDLNSGTRREVERTAQAPIQKEWLYRGYRKYKLHVWKLTGEPGSWQKQLNNYYDKTPVFAVVSGISKDSWKNIDKFCNAREVPCILPNTRTPGYSANNFYTLYFNAGPHNDASVIARYFQNNALDNNADSIVQLYDATSYSEIARNTLHEEITSNGKYNISSVSLETINNKHGIDQYIKNKNTTVIIWSEKLDASLLEVLSRNKNKIKSVFIPYYLATSSETRNKLGNIGIDILTSYPYVKPSSEPRATIRSNLWARSRKIDTTEKAVFTNTFTAINLLLKSIKHVRSHFNRAYIIELLEHKLDKAVLTGMYPKLSIGPNQRYASRGGYIMKAPANASLPLQPISQWLLPEKQVNLTQQ
jgi:ABC-type branched-subunit amino acid transport system substrate-binding protein